MKTEDILRWIIYLGAGLLAFLPLIVANSMYFPFITGKAFYFRIIVMLIFGAWVILALYDKEVRPQWSAVAWALAALLGVGLVASVAGVNPGDSIWSNFERMMGWITLLHVGLLFTTLAHTLKPAQWRSLFYLSMGVSVITAFIGFGEVPDESRIDATLGNPIYLATYALFHLMLAVYFMLRRTKRRLLENSSVWTDWRFWIFSAVGALNLAALWYTKTRGALLGLLAGLFVAAVLVAIFAESRSWARRLATGALILGVVFVGGFIAFKDAPAIQQNETLSRFANISLEEGTVGARLNIWDVALEGYTASPKTTLLGWGPGNFNYVFNTYYDPVLFSEETWFDRAHNVVVEWLVAAGPLGALAYLSLFGAAIYLIWKKDEGEKSNGGVREFSVLEKSLLTGLVVAYLVQNLSVFDHLVSYWVLTMILAWLHSRHIHHPDSGWIATIKSWFSSDDKLMTPPARAWTGTGVALGAITLAIMWNYPGYAQATTLIDALRESSDQRQEYTQALESYQSAIGYGAMGTQETREQLTHTAVDVVEARGADSEIAQDYLEVASQEMETQIDEEPEDLRHSVFYGQMLTAYGQYDAAVEQFARANEMGDGQKQKILFQLAQAQRGAGDTEAALESFRKAYELDKSFEEPALRYISEAIRSGQQETADQVLEEKFGTSTIDNEFVIQAYAAAEEYEKIIPIFEERLEESPNEPGSYVSLAAVLERAGQDEEAIAVLERAIGNFPQAETQINELIRQIRAGNPVRP